MSKFHLYQQKGGQLNFSFHKIHQVKKKEDPYREKRSQLYRFGLPNMVLKKQLWTERRDSFFMNAEREYPTYTWEWLSIIGTAKGYWNSRILRLNTQHHSFSFPTQNQSHQTTCLLFHAMLNKCVSHFTTSTKFFLDKYLFLMQCV